MNNRNDKEYIKDMGKKKIHKIPIKHRKILASLQRIWHKKITF